MSVQITTAFVEQYKANVLMLAQQHESRLAGAVRQESVKGKACFVERIGAVDMVDAASRHDDTPQIDTPHSRRKLTTITSRYADMVDNADKVRMLISPESSYAIAGAAAANRKKDDRIITALTGNSYGGVAGATTIALPSAQKIAHGSAGMTLAKLIEAKEILDAAEIDDDNRHIVMAAGQIADLLNNTTVTSADYNTVKALVRGQINEFMGFTFHRSQRLGTDATPSRQVVAFHRDSIVMGVGMDTIARISERSDKNYSVQVFLEVDVGATRVQEEGVVEIACNE
ncbi:MAG: hypothetical protein IME93_03165 [Proteobacteria bacterium]|nr:hypothetical protein [Pseudomonadota bacterium]